MNMLRQLVRKDGSFANKVLFYRYLNRIKRTLEAKNSYFGLQS